MAIELAVTDHRTELQRLKLATRVRVGAPGESDAEIVSPMYEAFNLRIRYVMKNRAPGSRHPRWKGFFYVGWRPVGQNQIMGWLEGLENGNDRFVPAWIKEAAFGG